MLAAAPRLCSRRPIGSVDEGIAVRIQERRFFASLQWVRLEQPPAPVRWAHALHRCRARRGGRDELTRRARLVCWYSTTKRGC